VITSPQAAVSGFLAMTGLLLATVTAVVALRAAVAGGGPEAPRPQGSEREMSLLLLLCAVLGLVRLLAWPAFYALLKSQVEGLSLLGVMCAYGVTRVHPALITALQVTKPLVLLALGFWLTLEWIDRQTRTCPFTPTLRLAALPVAVFASVDCLLELTYLGADGSGPRITCCTQFLEVRELAAPQVAPGLSGMSDSAPGLVLTAYAVLNLLTVGACRYLWRHGVPGFLLGGILWPIGLLGCGALGLTATWWAGWAVVAPRVLGLPYHHCVYELITDTDALGFAAALALAGNGCLVWPLLLQPLRGKATALVAAAQRRVYGWCAVAIASELLIVGVHLL
jgi:hypothetical protein